MIKGRKFIRSHKISCLALIIFAGTTVQAASVSSDGSVTIVTPITAQFIQDMTFGTIAPSSTVADTVKVNRGQNNDSICGANLTCFESGNRARIRISGFPDARFTISNPGSITLTSPNGDSMLVDNFVGGGSGNNTNWGGQGRLGSNGRRTFNIGATLHVGANQAIGAYSGTYQVTVEYQ